MFRTEAGNIGIDQVEVGFNSEVGMAILKHPVILEVAQGVQQLHAALTILS